jgi:hypothetical protein
MLFCVLCFIYLYLLFYSIRFDSNENENIIERYIIKINPHTMYLIIIVIMNIQVKIYFLRCNHKNKQTCLQHTIITFISVDLKIQEIKVNSQRQKIYPFQQKQQQQLTNK